MRKKLLSQLLAAFLLIMFLVGCGSKGNKDFPITTPEPVPVSTDTPAANGIQENVSEKTIPEGAVTGLEDGVYTAKFKTDSGMFHVNEANNGLGILTVKDGEMTIHVALNSKNIINLFPGTATEAAKAASVLEPTLDEVTYSDGYTEEVYGFDIPVPYLEAEFDCALIGKKGVWYDHKVYVTEPAPYVDMAVISEGSTCDVSLIGGSGRASIASPVSYEVEGDSVYATVVWSSPNYVYMVVDGVQYDPIQTEGNSTFRIPVSFDTDMEVSAMTTAMSAPHLIDYTLRFHSSSIK